MLKLDLRALKFKSQKTKSLIKQETIWLYGFEYEMMKKKGVRNGKTSKKGS